MEGYISETVQDR